MRPASTAKLLLRLLTIIALMGSAALAATTQYVVIQPVANMYSGPSPDTDVVSQAIYATTVVAVEAKDNWTKVRTPEDDYLGWIPTSVLFRLDRDTAYASSGKVVEVRALMANLYREADVTQHAPVLTVPFETRLEFVASDPQDARWLQVRLPDARLAWLQQGDVLIRSLAAAQEKKTTVLSITEMVALGKRFLGLPYTWGGRSSFGYDCSGFVQMLMRQRGYYIPRDADMQAAWTGFTSVKRTQLRSGDVLFFGSEGKVTHTAMYIGHGTIIHATTHEHPVIQISRLDQHWTKLLVGQRRVKQ